MGTGEPPRAAQFLERALLANFLIHFVAMASMAFLLLPAMPGGGTADDFARIARIAQHPWLWRLGWFPWQLTALADLLLSVSLLATPWIRRWPAIITVLLTAAAMVPDQGGQFLWLTQGVSLAHQAMRTGDASPYLAFERWVFPLVGGWGCVGYLLGALGWTYCLATTDIWSRKLTWLSIATWGVFAVSATLFFLPSELKPPAVVASIGNAVGFVLLQCWLIGATENVLRQSRIMPEWRSPRRDWIGRLQNMLANSRFARAIGEGLPRLTQFSDITDVVYVNYLLEADRVQHLVPPGLQLQRVGPEGRYTVFSILTYRHGHFGPAGMLRRIARSPIQTNWRLYVLDPQTHSAGVLFLTTAVDHVVYSLAGRWLNENVPMHLLKHAKIEWIGPTLHQEIDPGDGSGPDLRLDLHRPAGQLEFVGPWRDCFTDFAALLAHVVPQDRAMSVQPWYRQITRQEINLQIPLQSCELMEGTVTSHAAHAIAGEAEPVCFYVPSVRLRFYDVVRTALPRK